MKGHALLFHQDLLRNTALEHLTEDYSFFSYTANEALYLSKAERGTVLDCFKKINDELPQYFSRAFKRIEGCTPNEYRVQVS